MLIAIPIISPETQAATSVIDGSQYSTYRAMKDDIMAMGTIEHPYGSFNDSIERNEIIVRGFLLLNQPNGPFPNSGGSSYASDFSTTADYDICWLDENFVKQTFHVAENVGVTGGQNNFGGQIIKTLYRSGWFNDDIPAGANCWIENCLISFTVQSPIDFQYDKVAAWQINAAFSESIYIVCEYSLVGSGNEDYRLINDWNHPSATKPLWNGVNWNGERRATPAEYYIDSLIYDTWRNDFFFDYYNKDNITARSAIYGYCQALKERALSVHGWQSMLSLVNGAESLSIGSECIDKALIGLSTVQNRIATMSLKDIKSTVTEAIRNYQLAILYTDKGIVMDYEYSPIGSPEDESYLTVEEWRSVYIGLYIEPYISTLESEGNSNSFIAWLFLPNSLIFAGIFISFLAVAIYYKSMFAGIAAIIALAINWLSWSGAF